MIGSIQSGDGMVSTEFVTQEEAVIAHLFWAMAAVEVVTIAVAGRSVSGRMLAPDPDLRAAIFEPSPGQDIPERVLRKGKIVLVKYASLEDEYQFKSQLMNITPSRWSLAIPRDVRRTDRRIIRREEVSGSRRYTIQLHKPDGALRTLLVHDLSAGGIGIIFDPQLDRFREGQVFKGELSIPGRDPLSVRLEVLNVHDGASSATERIMGARFVGLGFSGCEAIATGLEGDP